MNLNKMNYTSTLSEQKRSCETFNYYVKSWIFIFRKSELSFAADHKSSAAREE